MKKQKKRNKGYNTTSSAPTNKVEEAKPVTRRDMFRRYGYRAAAVAVVTVGGWFIVQDVQATAREHDLTRIGNGVPAVVQIHDPSCSVCAALQKEARAAIKAFDEDELQFLVANIKDARGSKLAADNGVPHITLLLFDGKGKRHEIMRGPQDRSVLEPAFRQFVNQIQ